jgi:uncharacterized protein (DUF1697 family)
MPAYVGLLRAVNVGGTGKLAMRDLTALCEGAGLRDVRTYIASGNVVFSSDLAEAAVKAVLEQRLAAHAGRPIGVVLRTGREMAAVLAGNPFAHAPGNRVMALFLDGPATQAMVDAATGLAAGEVLALGRREIYIHYGSGMAVTKLRLPAARAGTVRNMNTVTKLAAMAAD